MLSATVHKHICINQVQAIQMKAHYSLSSYICTAEFTIKFVPCCFHITHIFPLFCSMEWRYCFCVVYHYSTPFSLCALVFIHEHILSLTVSNLLCKQREQVWCLETSFAPQSALK